MPKDIWNRWLESRAQPPLEGNEIYNERSEYPAHYMSEKDMLRWMSAETPMDLFKEPDPRAYGAFDYPTSGINKKPFPWSDQPEVAIMNQGVGEKEPWAPLYPVQDLGGDVLPAAQGVYEHEYGHFKDPRQNPYKMWSFPNHGYTTFGGLSGGLLQREFPGMVAEEKFWNNYFSEQQSTPFNNLLKEQFEPKPYGS